MNAKWTRQAVNGTDDVRTFLLTSFKDHLRLRLAQTINPHEQNVASEYVVCRPIPPHVVQYLLVMLDGIHANVLYEWMVLVHNAGYQPQSDVIRALMLTFIYGKYDRTVWVHPFRQLLGEEGTQAAWTLFAIEQQDEPTIQSFANWLTYPRSNLQPGSWVWTTDNTQQVLNKFLSQQKGHSGYYVNHLNQKAHLFALELAPTLIDDFIRAATNKKTKYSNWNTDPYRNRLRTAIGILQFRQKMAQAIETG